MHESGVISIFGLKTTSELTKLVINANAFGDWLRTFLNGLFVTARGHS
jgi:uncharacterized protein YgfB (UPF0149 family)